MAGDELDSGAPGPVDQAVVTIPLEVLAAEIEFAIAYTAACNPDRVRITQRGRGQFAAQVAAMLSERAGNGLSGMTLRDACSE